jgi:hypothetical protein
LVWRVSLEQKYSDIQRENILFTMVAENILFTMIVTRLEGGMTDDEVVVSPAGGGGMGGGGLQGKP